MALRSVLRLLTTHLVVALVALVVIGGATRVMEAGLACPDWPLCYGSLLPGRQMNLQVFLEWFHRLDAFLVGIALLVVLGLSVWRRKVLPPWLPWASGLAVGLVGLQGGLGALTVTGLLSSSTVTAHLATALLLVLLISGLDQCLASTEVSDPPPVWWCAMPLIATALVFTQCVLGGAMASQWAVDQCFSSGVQCEWLMRHRQLAMPAGLSVLVTAGTAFFTVRTDALTRGLALSAATLVGIQVALGILTLRWELQVPALTIAHQLVAALLISLLGAITGRALCAWSAGQKSPALEVPFG